MKKRLIALVITIIMILSTISSSPIYAQQKEDVVNKGSKLVFSGDFTIEYKVSETTSSEFEDMPNDWSTQSIKNCIEKGLLQGFEENGQKLIKPTSYTTRAQMATILNRIFDINGKSDLNGVLDVPSDSWFTDIMSKAAHMGIFVKDSYMRPNDNITREEAMTVIVRAFNIKTETNYNIENFVDFSELSSWAIESVRVLAANGYIHGNNGYLNPKAYMTRAELCKLLNVVLRDNEIENSEKEEVIEAPKNNKNKSSSSNSNKNNTIIEGLHAVTETTILAEGNNSNEFKLGFRYADDMTGVAAYMMVYSVKDIANVYDALKDKTRSEFDDYDMEEINKGKLITNLDYADGAANTYYSSQKDIITNQEITEPGLYHFYVLSLSNDGLIGIAEADKTIDKKPFPKDIIATRDGGYSLENYGVEFNTFSDDRIVNNIVFYSELGESNIRGLVSDLTANQIKELVDSNKAIYTGRDIESGVKFISTLKDFEGNSYDDSKIYYIYALAVSKDGALGLSKADLMLTPANGPAPLTNIGTGKGFVIPAGGSTSLNPNSKSYVQGYIDAFKQATPGIAPRVAVFETSSGAESTMYDYFYNDGESSDKVVLEKDGCEAVYIPLGIDNYESITNEKYFADLVKSCHIALLMGGDQAKHARALTNDDGSLTEVGKAIKYVFDHGGTIAGTSAGAQVLSDPAFQGGGNGSYEAMFWNDTEKLDMSDYNGKTDSDVDSSKTLNNIAYNSTGYVDLAAGRRVLLDTHFDARGRLGRLLVALRDTNNGITTGTAIGLDEGTGIRISEDTHIGTVFGNGGVFIVDADEAIWSDSEVFGVSNIKLNYLTEGDTYNFDSKEVTTSKNIIVNLGESIKTKENAFGTYQVSKILLELAKTTESKIVVPVIKAEGTEFATGSDFEVSFEKTESTKCYTSDENYKNGSAGVNLSEYNKTTIDNMKMSISAKEPTPDPLSIIGVFTNKGYDAKIEFNNNLKVGFSASKDYLVDLYEEVAEDYITLKRGNQTLVQDIDASLCIVEENVLRIVLAENEGDFQVGDRIVIHTNIADILGQKLNEELVYVLNTDQQWVIAE